jgi:DNA polymerase III delta prime subunit
VAYLMPPQQATEPVPAWGWQVLRFNASDEQTIDVIDEESDQLKRFLKNVFERRQQRDRAGVPG